ncbi:Uncharacterized protein FVE85_6274 [Porphyridium purpureum]|uniref:Uncharacterized protein n=1 Tax=Porphyridium purpureum TaxID=35688 RepID=A0A5J4Z3Y2_PORPP|nr:Uncharacterized protein FVE85_6274 [Porphyridium purpureum]|eukprot:POR7918..scf295_1
MRVGILGAGIFASESHFPVWRRLAGGDKDAEAKVEIVVVWSRSESSASALARKYSEVSPCDCMFGSDALDILLKREGYVDAVCIALPIAVQPQVVVQALQAGKHVLCEKPLAGSMSEARALIEQYKAMTAANANAPHLCIAENFRFEQVYRDALATIKSAPFGKVLEVSLVAHVPFLKDSKYEKTDWRRASSHEGGILLDSGVHMAAALRLLAGSEAESVSGVVKKKSPHLPKADTLAAVIETRAGVTITFHASYACRTRKFQLCVLGENGCVTMERGEHSERGEHGYFISVELDGSDGPSPKTFVPFTGIDNEIEGFVSLLSADTASQDIARTKHLLSAEEAFYDFALISDILRSSEQGGSAVQASSL